VNRSPGRSKAALIIRTIRVGLATVSTAIMVAGCIPGVRAIELSAFEPTPASPQPAPILTLTGQPTATAAPRPSPTPTVTVAAAADLPLGEIAYTIPLTIRHRTARSATLFFELAAPAPGSLFLRPTAGGELIETPLPPDQAGHLLTVDGLIPGTEYEVGVALQGEGETFHQPNFLGRAWGPVRFHTMREDGPLRFGVIGDASFGDPVTSALIEQMAAADLDFVLHAGDVVDETEQGVDPFYSYAWKFYTPFEPLLTQMPIYTVIGNHDYDSDIRWGGEPFYYHAFPPFPDADFPGQEARATSQYYAFAYGGIQFLMLDSQVLFGAPGRAEQAAWLAERLTDPRFRATIPVFHVSPFSSSSVHPDNSLPVQYEWVPLFDAANVPVVFSAHFHQYERVSHQGTTYVVSGGGSSITYAPGEIHLESVVFARRSHFVLAELEGDRLVLSAIAVEGEAIDRVELSIQGS
jgi:predicted phosphodiesterase